MRGHRHCLRLQRLVRDKRHYARTRAHVIHDAIRVCKTCTIQVAMITKKIISPLLDYKVITTFL